MICKTDVAIIGAGPVGLFAIFECGMLNLSVQVFDALDTVGGQCRALYPEKPIFDIPAWPRINGGDLVDRLVEQSAPFNPILQLKQKVVTIEPLQDGAGYNYRLISDTGTEAWVKAVIIAAGVGAFGPNRPPLANLEQFEGKDVFYYVRNREDFRAKKIMIAGGGDSAVDWALNLYEIAERVTVVHRRDNLRAAPANEAKLKQLAAAGELDLVIPYQMTALIGNERLEAVEVKSLDGQVKQIATDALLPFFGLSMSLGPIANWGLGLDKNHITVDLATCATSAPGIYAIGDIITYPGKLKLILCGFAEAAMAAHAIRKFIYPAQEWHFEYSTTKGVPAADK